MPTNIIPDQSANINLMIDGQVLHGQVSEGTPALKDPLEAIIDNVNRLNVASLVVPGSSNIGIKPAPTDYTNFHPATPDLEAALVAIDASLASGGGGIKAYQFFDKYLYNPKRNAIHQGVVTGTAVTVTELRAYLGVDAGYQISSMSDASLWTATTDSAAATYTADYFEGGACVGITKTGTTTSSGGVSRNFSTSSVDLTSKKVRVSIAIPAIAGGETLTGVRVTVGSGGSAANSKYWDLLVDVSGETLTAGNKYILEVDPATGGTVTGTPNFAAANFFSIVLLLSGQNGTFANFLVDHLIYTPDTAALNVNILKRSASSGLWTTIKQSADSYSFPALTGGALITKSTSLQNATLNDGDILFIDIPTTGSFGGQDLYITVKLL